MITYSNFRYGIMPPASRDENMLCPEFPSSPLVMRANYGMIGSDLIPVASAAAAPTFGTVLAFQTQHAPAEQPK
jgi:hypothetical protein